MKRCDTEGCERRAPEGLPVALCEECWLAYADFLRDVEAEPELAERPRLEVER